MLRNSLGIEIFMCIYELLGDYGLNTKLCYSGSVHILDGDGHGKRS